MIGSASHPGSSLRLLARLARLGVRCPHHAGGHPLLSTALPASSETFDIYVNKYLFQVPLLVTVHPPPPQQHRLRLRSRADEMVSLALGVISRVVGSHDASSRTAGRRYATSRR